MRDAEEILTSVQGRLGPLTAIVTGSGDTEDEEVGVGSAIARTLAAAGAAVVLFDREPTAAERTIGRIHGRGDRATACVGDVASRSDCDAAAKLAVNTYGHLEILVNNAATLGVATDLNFEDDEFANTLDINLIGAVRMTRACSPHLGAGSSIVNITSLGALRTFGRLDYEASKGGLISLTNTLAVQLGPRGIRVNGVCPGQVWTPLGKRRLAMMGQGSTEIAKSRQVRAAGCPLRTEGTAWDIALAVLFLVSEDARWIAGHSLVVDGGQSGVVGTLAM